MIRNIVFSVARHVGEHVGIPLPPIPDGDGGILGMLKRRYQMAEYRQDQQDAQERRDQLVPQDEPPEIETSWTGLFDQWGG